MSRRDLVTCTRCGREFRFGRTENGRAMPVDADTYAHDDTRANLALHRDHTGRLNVRVLKAGEQPEPYEHRGMPHFATCTAEKTERDARAGRLAEQGVIPFPKVRRRRKAGRKGKSPW